MLPDKFTINGRSFSRESLLDHAGERITASSAGKWERKLFRFIIDLLNEEHHIIQMTSGTTGEPKVYELNRTAMVNSARMTLSYFNLKPGDSALLCLPVDYIAGKMMVVRAFEGGLNLQTTEPSGSPVGEPGMYTDFTAMVPLQVYEVMKTPGIVDQIIGTLIIGGGEINEQLRRKLAGLQKTRVYETFAMTETLTHFAVRKLNGPVPDPLFWTMKGVTIGTDDRGCLAVDIEGITNGTITTNDLVEIRDNCSFAWLGRYDNVIKTGGIKVIPELVEKKIRELTGIENELVIAGITDERLGQKVILIIEDPKGAVDSRQLIALMKKGLPRHELPKEIQVLSSFPRNSSMKVDRVQVTKNIMGK